MKTLTLRWEFLDYWHHGTGGGADPELDNRVHLDASGLPVLSASAVKGLLKEAIRRHARFADGLSEQAAEERAGILFGSDNPRGPSAPGLLHFEEARIPRQTAATIQAEALGGLLRTRVSQTAREPDYENGSGGVARDKSLRSMEVALPCVLITTVSESCLGTVGDLSREWTAMLEDALPFLREACGMRHRGLGRCRVTVSGRTEDSSARPGDMEASTPPQSDRSSSSSETLWFKATLLSPTVLSVSSRTEGGHHTLRQIHGSEWLGVLAGRAASRNPALLAALLRGDILCSHAFPASGGRQAVPMPLCFVQAKGDEEGPIHNRLISLLPDIQWEPVGGGFFDGSTIVNPPVGRQLRASILPGSGDRASDGRLFEFEHLKPGTSFIFSVTAPIVWHNSIIQSLMADIRIGRARSSGHGRVSMTKIAPVPQTGAEPYLADPKRLLVLLTTDLALFRNGSAVVQPQASDFGWPAPIRWLPEASSLKLRRYSPWNSFHRGATLEREVIEAGSILVFERDDAWSAEELARLQQTADEGFGLHRNEGLGRCLINPPWLVNTTPKQCLRQQPHTQDGFETSLKAPAASVEPEQWILIERLQHQASLFWDLKPQLLEAAEKMVDALKENPGSMPAPRQWRHLEGVCEKLLKQPLAGQFLFQIRKQMEEPDRHNRGPSNPPSTTARWRKEWAPVADTLLGCLINEDAKDPGQNGRALKVLTLACRSLARTQQPVDSKDSK